MTAVETTQLETATPVAEPPAVDHPLPSGRSRSILGMRIDELDYDRVVNQVRQWAETAQSRYVCVSNVHMVMETYDDPRFAAIVNNADLVGADGMPVIYLSRWLGLRQQSRVFGPELILRVCQQAAKDGIPVGFYGSTPAIIRDILNNVTRRFPGLNVAYSCSPPFRPLTAEEANGIVQDINASGARIVLSGWGARARSVG